MLHPISGVKICEFEYNPAVLTGASCHQTSLPIPFTTYRVPDFMDDFIRAVSEMIDEHWVKFVTAGAFTALGWLIARRRAARDWKKREFFDRINFSLNSIRDGTLRIRTLSEKSCSDVFLNKVATDQLIRLAQQTTAEDPIVPIPQQDCWYYLNAVLNELSEQFAIGLIQRDVGHPVLAAEYVICMTNECDGEVRTRKVRAMVIRRDLLTNLPAEFPEFESPNHRIRWKTLQQLQTAYKSTPWKFLTVELTV
ncbi:MAG: hypothetical protein R3C19_04920 [Planctomycetaceae bacterium]